MNEFVVVLPPEEQKTAKKVLSPDPDLDLIVHLACDMCGYGWQKWSWDFEELMLCCSSCKCGEPIYDPFGNEWFVKSFHRITNWISVSIQSIETVAPLPSRRLTHVDS